MPIFQGFLVFSTYCAVYDGTQGSSLWNVMVRFGGTLTVGYIYDQIVQLMYRRALRVNTKTWTTGLATVAYSFVLGVPLAWYTRRTLVSVTTL